MALVIARATFLVYCILSSADFVIRSICLAGDVFFMARIIVSANDEYVLGVVCLVLYLHFCDIIV